MEDTPEHTDTDTTDSGRGTLMPNPKLRLIPPHTTMASMAIIPTTSTTVDTMATTTATDTPVSGRGRLRPNPKPNPRLLPMLTTDITVTPDTTDTATTTVMAIGTTATSTTVDTMAVMADGGK